LIGERVNNHGKVIIELVVEIAPQGLHDEVSWRLVVADSRYIECAVIICDPDFSLSSGKGTVEGKILNKICGNRRFLPSAFIKVRINNNRVKSFFNEKGLGCQYSRAGKQRIWSSLSRDDKGKNG